MDDVSFWDAYFLWRDPIIAASVSALLLGYLGFYVVLTRNAFVSAAVSQLAGLGVVGAMLLSAAGIAEVPPLALGVVLGVVGTSLFTLPARSQRVTSDSMLATAFIGASALTLVGARYLTQEYQHVKATLYGDAVVAGQQELYLLAGTGAVVLVVHLLFRHRFMLVSFDPDAARAQGMRTGLWSLLLALTIALSISVVTRGIGALPAFAFSVLPASAALLLTERIRLAYAIAMVLALGAAAFGYYLSFMQDLPTGPTLVAVVLLGLVPGGLLALVRRLRAG